MTPADIKKVVRRIRENTDDNEVAHSMEDDLYKSVLSAIAKGECEDPAECAKAALTAAKIDFARWYA